MAIDRARVAQLEDAARRRALTLDYDELFEAAADAFGLELAAAYYDSTLPSGAQTGTARIALDSGDGPMIVTKFAHVGISAVATWEIALTSGSRNLIEGRVQNGLALGTGASSVWNTPANAQVYRAPPFYIFRGDVLTVAADALTGGTISAGNYVQLVGYHLRAKGTRDRVGDEAEQFIAWCRRVIGEAYVVGVAVPSGGGVVSYSLTHPAAWGLVYASHSGSPTDVRIRLGGIDLAPRGQAQGSSAVFMRIPRTRTRAGDLIEARTSGGTGGNVVIQGVAFRG